MGVKALRSWEVELKEEQTLSEVLSVSWGVWDF